MIKLSIYSAVVAADSLITLFFICSPTHLPIAIVPRIIITRPVSLKRWAKLDRVTIFLIRVNKINFLGNVINNEIRFFD